jgi:ketosteroid isomerase-like protein
MPMTGIDLIHAEYDAMSRQDWEAVFSEAHPDFEFLPPDGGIGGKTIFGPRLAREDIRAFFSPYEEVVIEAEEFHERGDAIAVFLRLRTRPRGSSALVEIRVGQLWTVRDGKLARLQIFAQRERALEAAEAAEGRAVARPS